MCSYHQPLINIITQTVNKGVASSFQSRSLYNYQACNSKHVVYIETHIYKR